MDSDDEAIGSRECLGQHADFVVKGEMGDEVWQLFCSETIIVVHGSPLG